MSDGRSRVGRAEETMIADRLCVKQRIHAYFANNLNRQDFTQTHSFSDDVGHAKGIHDSISPALSIPQVYVIIYSGLLARCLQPGFWQR